MLKSPRFEQEQAARNKLEQDTENAVARIRKAFMDMNKEMFNLKANAAPAPLDETYKSKIIGNSNYAESFESDSE